MSPKKLSEIADIQSGLVLSRKEAALDSKNAFKYKRLNLRSINDDGSINAQSLDDYYSSEKLEGQFITAENDIIMRLFMPICPVIISKEYENIIVPSQLCTIRVNSSELLPAFLYHYLLQSSVRNSIELIESGSAPRSIRVSTLSDVEIPLIPLHRQEIIAALGKTHINRKNLYFELIHQLDVQTDALIRKVIGGEVQ